jgi:hypothetical protein
VIPKLGKNAPNGHKMSQMSVKYSKCPYNIPNACIIFQMSVNIPNGHKIYQHFPIYGPLTFTQIGIFGLKNKPSGNPALLR